MKKKNIRWTIRRLQEKFDLIEFPEYQREPTVWDLESKQKLIDSMLRNFDISSIYLYKRDDGYYECIDGRQRINAILSFLGLNSSEPELNNKFAFKSSDELLESDDRPLAEFDGKTFQKIVEDGKSDIILDYEFNVIEITDIEKSEDLNLMFLRLQLGKPLNAGEKLNAMRGNMRDFIFGSLGKHNYFAYLDIPKRRFWRELTAAQIAANFFSLQEGNGFMRTRFVDPQEFLKKYSRFDSAARRRASLLGERFDSLCDALDKSKKVPIKNRAIGISIFFFVSRLIETGKAGEILRFLQFLNPFLDRLRKEVAKGIEIEPQYRDLLTFQSYVSQAAVEKYAIENRQQLLEEYFEYYLRTDSIKGDT